MRQEVSVNVKVQRCRISQLVGLASVVSGTTQSAGIGEHCSRHNFVVRGQLVQSIVYDVVCWLEDVRLCRIFDQYSQIVNVDVPPAYFGGGVLFTYCTIHVFYLCFQYTGSPYIKQSISSLDTTRHTIQMFLIFCRDMYLLLVYLHLYVWLWQTNWSIDWI